MLFSYKPLENFHNIQNLDLYYNYFFENLFIIEPQDIGELIHEDFLAIYNAHGTAIKENLINIHQIYLVLSDEQKQIVQSAFENNRQIENICNGMITPIKYEQLPFQIKSSLKELYNKSWGLLTNKDNDTYTTIKDRCGNIYNHYSELFERSRQIFTICPFCGIEELLSEYDASDDLNEEGERRREAYDHYFPKKLYPFIAIEFSNLVPMCHHCNSDYKSEYDTAYNNSNNLRQECFYPFSPREINNINFLISNAESVSELSSSNLWEIIISSLDNENEKVSSWNRIFKIKSRYKNRIKLKERSWKNKLVTKVLKKSDNISWDDFKIELYSELEVTDQVSDIVRKVYYDYFFENLLDGYLEEIA